ncbi:MAG: HAD family phosphatase [Clostridiaceae bacterium]|jgi:HAD superfamily hydrolase (TIGR01509 family)|nr:HAD family phosphatase [Clostridiaceae bacterium]
MLNAKGSIFDLDGTILDSMGMWMDIDIRFLREHGIRATEDYSQAVKTMGYRGAAEYTVARYGLSLSPEEVIARWSEMADAAYASEIRLKSGAIDYLRCLREAGQKLAVATALGFSSVESALSNNRILDLFDVFTMVHEVKRGKTHPDIYLLAAERLGFPPRDCVVYEDILPGILAAKSAGFTVCGVYDFSSARDWDRITEAADHTIADWSDLL